MISLKKIAEGLITLFLFVFLLKPVLAQDNTVNLYIFRSEACPHCRAEEAFLQKIQPDYPNLVIHDYEISKNRDNALLFQKVGEELDVNVGGVPMTFIGNEHVLGFWDEETTGSQIISLIEKYAGNDPDILKDIIQRNSNSPSEDKVDDEVVKLPKKFDIPIIGTIDTKSLSLPALTFVIGLLDGFNPCAMWVLLFLISMLLGMKDRRKMWILGSTFIIASGFVYFLFLAAWLNLFLFLGFVTRVRVAIGIVAIVLGIYQLRDYVKNKDGTCKVEGGEKRKKVFERIREITHNKQFIFAFFGIIVLAFAVNLVELICSAGFPAVYTQILSITPMTKLQYYLYLLFYIFIFMIDDLIVFIIAMITLHAVGVDSKYSRFSRLIGGSLILIIGILMIFKPELLMFG